MVVVIFGVAGSGKTTIGSRLANALGWKFYDADRFHSAPNVEKMRRGIALTDTDRRPWLEELRELVTESLRKGEDMVLACSALKEKYREPLHVSPDVKWVYLKGTYKTIADRLERRSNHFMNRDLLRSQFDTLEEPLEPAIAVDIESSPHEIVQTIRRELRI